MKEILLANGRGVALVDDEDAPLVADHRWWRKGRGREAYAYTSVPENGGLRWLLMHRVILNAPAAMQVDHINGDGLDNRRANLRLCTFAENRRNSRALGGHSRFKGVSRKNGKWCAQIRVAERQVHLGYFRVEAAAAAAYDAAAREHFGEFARLNFPKEGEQKAAA